MSKKTFPRLRIVLNHLKVFYRYNCTKMLQMYLSQPLWKFIAFWCWRSICITIGQIMGNFHYNPINISRVIKKNNFFAFFKCPHTMHWILNMSRSMIKISYAIFCKQYTQLLHCQRYSFKHNRNLQVHQLT